MEPNSFFHVALKVPDIERSTAFYRDLFDAEILTHVAPEDAGDDTDDPATDDDTDDPATDDDTDDPATDDDTDDPATDDDTDDPATDDDTDDPATDDDSGAPDGGEPSGVEYVALAVADKRVYLFDRAPYEASGDVEGPLPFGFLHYGFVVDDLETAYATFADAGVEFLMEPTVLDDLYIAFLTDPAGVRVELLEHR